MNQKDEASLRKTAALIWRCARARSVLEQGTITPYGLLSLNEVVGGQGLHLGSAGPDGAQPSSRGHDTGWVTILRIESWAPRSCQKSARGQELRVPKP